MPERVAQDQLLERDARAEAQRARAQPADRAGRDLDHPHAVAVDPQLGVHRALRPARSRRRRAPVTSSTRASVAGGEARRRDVDRLLEVRADERVGLVEHREHLERRRRAGGPRPRPRRPGTYSSTSSGPSAMAPIRGDRGARRVGVVGADHALAPRAAERLHDARGSRRRAASRSSTDREPRLGHLGRAPARVRIAALSRVAATASGGLWGKPSRSPAVGGDQRRPGRRPPPPRRPRPVGRAPRWRRRPPRGRRAAPPRPGRPSPAASACASSEPTTTSTPRPGRGPHEVGRPVGGGGQQEEDPRHGPIMVGHGPSCLTITDEARATGARGAGRREPTPTSLALWVEVSGEQAGAYTYLMEFRPARRARRRRARPAPRRPLGRHPRRQRRPARGAPRSTSTAAW